ncbi:MAG: polysaccharide deacetylase [Methylocystis sp.]
MRRILVLLVWAFVACAATARGEDDTCGPVNIAPGRAPTGARVRDYAPIFETCVNGGGESRLAIRRMRVDGAPLILTVDPQSLRTSLERASCWRCEETSDAAQAKTRYLQALHPPADPSRPPALVNAGLIHGVGVGAFVTGDLCPSRKRLDRAFFEKLAAQGPGAPVTLAVSGGWIARHGADFAWLRQKERVGALAITWANHSYSHPYVRRLADRQNYFLRPGVDVDREIFETEKLIIAEGETPSVFFRFPGLVADAALLERVRSRHLAPLGADSWLALGLRPRPGSIVLVHPNGNEPVGLKLFSRLIDAGAMPLPLRPINEAP